jgi:hypothetical protein
MIGENRRLVDAEILREALLSELMKVPAGGDRTRLETLVGQVLDQAMAGHLEFRLLLIRLILDAEASAIVHATEMRNAVRVGELEDALSCAANLQ